MILVILNPLMSHMIKSDHSIRSYNIFYFILRNIRLWATRPVVQFFFFFVCKYACIWENVILMFKTNKIQDAPCDSVFINVLYVQMWPLDQKLPILFIFYICRGGTFLLPPQNPYLGILCLTLGLKLFYRF